MPDATYVGGRAAADRNTEGVWPDQSAVHGVLLDQIKDAYAEGIADTIDRLRVRAAEMLPEVARFTLDEIEALAAADREKPDGCHAPHCWSEYGTPCGTCPVAAASPDERLREALREIVAAFPSPPDREMDDEEIEKWYADHGDWFQRLAALAAADREAPDEETKR